MKRYRPVLAMLAAVALFTFYNWDVDHVERGRLRGVQAQQVLFESPDSVVAIEFENENGTFRVERTGAGEPSWDMKKPVVMAADPNVLFAYIENLRGAKRQAEFKPESLAAYGLGQPTQRVTVELKREGQAGVEKKTLLFGKQPVAYGPVYAQILGEDTVFTVSEWFYRQSAKDLDSLRDRTIARGDLSKARKLTITTRSETFDLTRDGPTTNQWMLVRPGKTAIPADRNLMERVVNGLVQSAFISVEDKPTSSSLEMGFEDPSLRLEADGMELIRLGATIPGKEQFLARGGNGVVGVVTGTQFIDFLRPSAEWGTKRFIWLAPEEIREIQTSSGNTGLHLLLDKEKWVLPEMPGVAVRTDRIDKFRQDLLAFSALQFVKAELRPDEKSKYGLVEEAYRVVVTDMEGRSQGFRFGVTDTKEGFTYVLREQDSSLWKVDVRAQRDVYKFRSDMEDRRIFAGLSAGIGRFEIEFGGQQVSFEKTPGAWNSKLPDQNPVLIPNSVVDAFLLAFGEMEIQSELLSPAHEAPKAVFRFYRQGEQSAWARGELVTRNPKSRNAFFYVGGRLIEVSSEDFEAMDSQTVNLLVAAKAATEASAGK